MAGQALGLVEVRGKLGAIVAADAALKAANVSLVNIEPVKAGLNTVHLVGDVGAIKAAVDAGVAAVEGLGCYLGSHVIPRPDNQIDLLFKNKVKNVVEQQEKSISEKKDVTEIEVTEEVELEAIVESVTQVVEVKEDITKEEPAVNHTETASKGYSFEELDKLKVVELRKIAYKRSNIGLTKKEIKFANKKTLIKALLK